MAITRNQRRPPAARRTVEQNNNNIDENDNNLISLELLDGSSVTVGDIVWIQHENCLNTPAIVYKLNIDCK